MNLTQKELFALEDLLNAEQILTAKLKHYCNCCNDSEIKAKFEQMLTKHKEYFSMLLRVIS